MSDGNGLKRLSYYDLELEDVRRAVLAWWEPSNPSYEPDDNDMAHMADALHAAFAGRRLHAATPSRNDEVVAALEEAATELLQACLEDFGDFPDDDGPVALGELGGSAVTFPMVRNLQTALAALRPATSAPENEGRS